MIDGDEPREDPEMNTTPETPAEMPAKSNRRGWWIGAGGVVLGIVAIAYVALTGDDEETIAGPGRSGGGAGRSPSGGGRSLDHRFPVREHPRQQAYGPGWSERRDIVIPGHFRGPAEVA